MTEHFQKHWQADPFLMIGGEVHNSNSSTAAAMEPAWRKADELCLNTVLAPVSWEMLEPEEGRFDFTAVDSLLAGARAHGKRLVLLWFGAWKNAQCSYAPPWVKRDTARFLRAEVKKGQRKTNLELFHDMPYTTLSYLCEATARADARAFAALMAHLRGADAAQKTVYMIQVENETGLQGAAREQSDAADAAFAAAVDPGLIAYLKQNTAEMAPDLRAAVEAAPDAGSWAEVFGPAAEEAFSAYHIARHVQAVAAAGLAEYDLPLAVNCWLDKGEAPGLYPSGGPVARMMEVWQYAAPAIDLFAPDIYVHDFCGACDAYVKRGNPLFIPETATHGHAAPRLVYTVGHYHAVGYSPFGFEDMGGQFGDMAGVLFGIDTSDPLLSTVQDVGEYAWYARTLGALAPLLTARYGTGRLQAVIHERPDETAMRFAQFGFAVTMDSPLVPRKDGVCLALELAPDEFYLIACGCVVEPFSTQSGKPHTDYLCVEEGNYANGRWQPTRRLNGDETATLRFHTPTLLRLKLLAYG